ncbi:DAK2 domain-containing protein [Proteinivorax hydrogeniformans]|uniref:DAK2 domain-containing protein n=1 Tax=Proteinivorax hydrogeniformans TaxID=1826727 RepID=A0AAU8HR21_9FIRM
MDLKQVDGKILREMLIMGAEALAINKERVDSLNVFPVPDGDTGTNMNLTMGSAINEIEKQKSDSVKAVAKALSNGSLMGARGNSGVILSQLFRGFSKAIEDKENVTPVDFAVGLNDGVKTAYKAVLKPVEGTILTVSKFAAKAALLKARDGGDIIDVMEACLEEGQKTLDKTPEMLEVLKQANVVDAGGKGLLVIYEGWLRSLKGEKLDGVSEEIIPEDIRDFEDEHPANIEDIEHGYCTEFLVQGNNIAIEKLKEKLNVLGDSLLVVGDEDVVKVHVHTNNPGQALENAISYGELQGIKIDNMRAQARDKMVTEQSKPSKPAKDIGIITVASGKGLSDIFTSMGVDYVIEGGQTMNPSTEDFIKAIERINAKSVILIPNNSNIILAAQQAEKISPIPARVIPSKTIPQGIASLLNYQAEGAELDEVFGQMQEAISDVKSGQITYAVRDSKYDDLEINKGDILGIAEGEITVLGKGVKEITLELLEKIVDEESEIITLFYGQDMKEEESFEIVESIEAKFEDVEVELHYGGQPLYYFLVSVE